jgi:acetyl esterase
VWLGLWYETKLMEEASNLPLQGRDTMTTQNRQPLDPAIAEMERKWKESGIPDLYAGRNGPVSRERARNIRALLYPKPKLPMGKLERASITGPNGPITIEIVQPFEGAPIGTLVYFHGGGYIVGDIDSHQAHAIRFANRARVVVVNVDYRLAPEHPFPQGVEDAIASAKWAHANLDRLGGAGKPLAVGGDSAGGNFAAVTAVKCRDAGIKLAAQVLLYGAFDVRKDRNPDIREPYFGSGDVEAKLNDVRASPILADLRGLAPAIMGVGPYDFLYEHSVNYHAALKAAGVHVVYREFPTLNHGFFSYTSISSTCATAADLICDDLRGLFV